MYQPARFAARRGGRRDVRPEHVPVGRRQQLQRYGRQHDETTPEATPAALLAAPANPPSGVLPTPPDTIEEFKVATVRSDRRLQRLQRRADQMVTKRGTNDFHGSAYYYYSSSNVGGANSLGQQPHAQRRPRLHADSDHPQQPLRLHGGRSDAAEVLGRQDLLLLRL